MENKLSPYSFLDEYIDFLDASAETKGEIREKLISSIEDRFEKDKEAEWHRGWKDCKEEYEVKIASMEKWWALKYKRETAEKEDYVRMYFRLYKAITQTDKDPKEIVKDIIEYLDAEFDKVFGLYEDQLPVGLKENPADINLLTEIKGRVQKRGNLLGRLGYEQG